MIGKIVKYSKKYPIKLNHNQIKFYFKIKSSLQLMMMEKLDISILNQV